MAAMTRSRANSEGVVSDLVAEYYVQRTSAGMILSEGINISRDALGSPFTPGIFTGAQMVAWKKVTNAVHAKGGVIFAQLWHTGCVGHSVDRNGLLPVAPSAVAIEGMQHFISQGMQPYETPRALTVDEIQQTIQDYKQAALNAIEVGFDGVELHGANGYLPNQFLADSSNIRTDEYGGSIQNKARFIIEVMQALIEAAVAENVGIKLSPLHSYGGVVFNDPLTTYTYLIEELNKLDFAFLELMKRTPMFPSPEGYPEGDEVELIGKLFKNILIANGGYLKKNGEAELQKGIADLVSFGSSFLANPDLPQTFAKDAALNQPDRNTMFGGNEKGYTDYPFLS